MYNTHQPRQYPRSSRQRWLGAHRYTAVRWPRRLLPLIVAALLCLPVTLAQAQAIGPSEAASKVRQSVGGKVLKVKASPDKTKYYVKVLLPGGKVRTVTVDRKSGSVRK